MRYGPSTNTLMTADEYARLDRIRAHALMSSVSRTLPAWSDESTPRTDRPVRFVWLSDRVYPSATPGVPSWRSYPPRVARGYMQSVRPVRFPA